MDATVMHGKLVAALGDAVGELVTDNPDPYVMIRKDALARAAAYLKNEPDLELDFLESMSGVDLGDQLQIVYHVFSYKHRHGLVLKAMVPYDDTTVPSVSDVWRAAEWHEREQFDLFGFTFSGHRDLRHLLLPNDWVGYPLRKSYVYPEQYHGIDHHRPDPKDQFRALDERTRTQEALKDVDGPLKP